MQTSALSWPQVGLPRLPEFPQIILPGIAAVAENYFPTAGRSLQGYLPKDFQGLTKDNHSSGGVLLWILRAASTPQDPVYSSQGRQAAPESGPRPGQAQH